LEKYSKTTESKTWGVFGKEGARNLPATPKQNDSKERGIPLEYRKETESGEVPTGIKEHGQKKKGGRPKKSLKLYKPSI